MSKYLAIDLGAESGRAVVGHLEDDRLRLEEIAPLSQRAGAGPGQPALGRAAPVERDQTGLGIGEPKPMADDLASIGLDTWGVDFGLLAADDTLLGNPYHYRDSRTDGMLEEAFEIVPRAEIYETHRHPVHADQQPVPIAGHGPGRFPALAAARTFLNMPDLFNFWLSGRKASEFTIATTSQCYDPRAGDWARGMLETLGIPVRTSLARSCRRARYWARCVPRWQRRPAARPFPSSPQQATTPARPWPLCLF